MTRPAASGGATDGERDEREPKVCPRCGHTCTYDGWDHVHPDGLGIGSCPPVASQTDDRLRDALRIHHPIMRSETGPFSGCRCGAVKLGQDVIAHVVTELRRALDGTG